VIELVVLDDEATLLTDEFRPRSGFDESFGVTLRALVLSDRFLFLAPFLLALSLSLPLSTLSSHSSSLPVNGGNTFE
jgi:membrane glycosyltransferase